MKNTMMLKKNYEFKKIFSKGKYYSGKTIEAYVLKNYNKKNYLGLAVSVKSGHAFQRNKVKRLLRENYQFYEDKIKTGYSIVFLWKKNNDIKNANYKQINLDMCEIFKNAHISL